MNRCKWCGHECEGELCDAICEDSYHEWQEACCLAEENEEEPPPLEDGSFNINDIDTMED